MPETSQVNISGSAPLILRWPRGNGYFVVSLKVSLLRLRLKGGQNESNEENGKITERTDGAAAAIDFSKTNTRDVNTFSSILAAA